VVGESRIGLTIFADEANRDMTHAQLVATYGPMLKGAGVLELLWVQAQHGSWSISVGSSDENLDAHPTQSDRDLAAQVAAALDGEVEDLTF
jgi:hypothetical protein